MSNITRLTTHPANSSINPVVAVTVKTVYGNQLVYPANTQAEILAKIAGTKTITLDTLYHAQAMGFRIVCVYPAGEIQVAEPRKLFETAGDCAARANRKRESFYRQSWGVN